MTGLVEPLADEIPDVTRAGAAVDCRSTRLKGSSTDLALLGSRNPSSSMRAMLRGGQALHVCSAGPPPPGDS